MAAISRLDKTGAALEATPWRSVNNSTRRDTRRTGTEGLSSELQAAGSGSVLALAVIDSLVCEPGCGADERVV